MLLEGLRRGLMEGKKKPKTNAKDGRSGRSVPFAGDVGDGRRHLLSSPSSCSSLPFSPDRQCWSPPCTQAAAPLPLLATEGLEASFAISLSINVNIVSAGCPGQNNSLKGHPSVLLWLSTKALFCQVLPTHCLPIHPSVHPISPSSKEPKH